MPADDGVNRRITLASHPRGLPNAQDFRLETQPIPKPGDGQILLRTLYLSLDPYMRNLMEEIGPGRGSRLGCRPNQQLRQMSV